MGGGNEGHEEDGEGTCTAELEGQATLCNVGRRKLRWSGTRASVETDVARGLMAKYKGLVLVHARVASRRRSIESSLGLTWVAERDDII